MNMRFVILSKEAGMRFSIVAAALACLAIPTSARAHGGNNDANVAHACIGNVTKIVRIVGVSGSCLSSPPSLAETPAHWSIQGPQGPQGLQGVQGPQGPQGMPGTNGINGTNGVDGTSVTVVGYFSGNRNGCPNGGLIFTAGNPAVSAYVCNGTNGVNGVDGQDGTNNARADGPCFDNINRYVDCGNGTVTDVVTGLIWLKNATCLIGPWAIAQAEVAALKDGECGLTDGSSEGDWRLPTKDEWSAMIARAVALGCRKSLTNDAGTACFGDGSASSFGFVLSLYWSSTSDEASPSLAWFADLSFGGLLTTNKNTPWSVWPVRDGSR